MMQAHTAPPVWPDSADALADEHVCPSCFHPVTLPDCRVCGFAFTDARAADVLGIGREMFALEDRRRTIIDAIIESATATSETAAASALPVEAARVEAVPAEVAPVVSRIADVTGMPVTSVSVDLRAAAPPAPADVAPAATVPPAASVPSPRPPRRRLTVPVLLLIVGVSLVGIAAVFFLLLAWFVADILVRALIIGAITLATIATASMLRRRSLTATAEGIGALGVILLALDAWALRANDLFGAGSMEPAVYAGSAALAVGVVCRVWSRLSHLRGPDLAALLALPAGLGLLVAGLLPLDTETAIAAGLIGAAAGGLAHALPAPWSAARDRLDSVPERTALAAIGVASLIAGAGVAAFAGLDDVATPLWSGAAIIVVGVAHVLVLRERRGEEPLPGARALAATAAAVAAVAAASLGWQLAARSDLPVYEFLAAPVIAVVVAVALDRVRTRRFALRLEPSAEPSVEPSADADAGAGAVAPRRGILSLSVSVATVAAGGVAVVSTLWLLVQSLRSTAAIAWTWEAWRTPVFAMSAGDAATAVILTAVASAIIAVLLFLTPSAGRPGMRDARPAVAAVLVVAGAAGTGIPALIVGVAAVVAIAALIALGRGSSRIGWGIAAGLGAAAAFTAGVAAPWLWIIGVLIAVAVPIAARRLVRPHGAAAVLLALAPIGVGVLTALIAPTAISAAFAVPADAAGGFALLHWTALITLAAAVAVPLDPPSRTAVALSSYLLFAVSLLSLVITPAGAFSTSTGATVSTVLGEPALAIVRCALTLALLSIVALGRTPVGALPSKAAAALVAPMAAATGTAALETLRSSDQAAFALLAVATAAAVAWAGALTPARAYRVDPLAATDAAAEHPDPAPFPVLVRRALDLGAVVTALAWAWTGSFELAWAMLALVAVGIAATSVTRGWAAPVFAGSIAAIETRAPGVPLSEAPRRLLVWPAFAAATLALWFWLSSEVMDEWVLEPFVLPPAVGLVVLGVVLVWLRRRVEAAIAVVSSFALGLVVLAIAGWSGTPARGTIVALVAAALCILLAWTPLRRVRGAAIAGAATAIVAIALVTIERALHDPSATAWLLLLVAAGFASAAGLVRGAPAVASGADDASPALPHEVVYAFVIPPVALIAAALATLPSVDEPVVLSAALGVLALVHVASAALHRLPFAATARWTAFAGAFTVGAFGIVSGTARAIEAITIPLAALTLAGAALAMLRRHRAGLEWPGAERAVWLAGLVVAVLPSVLAPANDPRTWLVVCGALLAAVGSLVAPISDDTRLKAPSALLLTTAAVVMGLRALFDPAVESGEFAAIVAGIGAIAVAAVLVWMSDAEHTSHAGAAVAGIGAALLVAWAAVRAGGPLAATLAQTTLAVCIAGIASVGGAWLLRLPKWTGIGSVLALGGVVIAAIAAGARFLTIAPTPGSGIEPDFWAVAVVAVFVAAGVMALRSSPSRTTAAIVGAAFAAVVVVFAVAEAALLAWADSDELRATLTMAALAAVGVVGVVWRARLGLALAVTAAVASATFGIIALTAFGVRPVELVTVPPALGLIALGVRSLRRDSVARTWPALGPGLVLLTVPSLLHDFGESELWRVVALGVVAIVLVVIGAVFKLQAPLVLGSIVLLVHAVAQLWPWISSAYVAVPWWLWLGIGGALLIFIAARYEKRMRELRAAFAAVVSLR